MAQKPITQVLLTIPQALQDSITTDSGIKLYISPDYKKEWQAAVTATIAALPIKISKQDEEIISQLQVGDEIAMSYQVVSDLEFKGDGHRFMASTEENDYVKEFINGKGETVRVYGLPKRAGIAGLIWVGTYQNKRREVISGVQGSESDVERWLSQFPFGKTDEYSHNNFFEYNGKDYWKCDPSQIFAKKVKGHWVAVGNRVLCKPIDEEVPAEVLQHIQHSGNVKIRYQDRAKVESSPKGLSLKKGQVVSFQPNHVEKYDFNGSQYYLINERLVQGLWN